MAGGWVSTYRVTFRDPDDDRFGVNKEKKRDPFRDQFQRSSYALVDMRSKLEFVSVDHVYDKYHNDVDPSELSEFALEMIKRKALQVGLESWADDTVEIYTDDEQYERSIFYAKQGRGADLIRGEDGNIMEPDDFDDDVYEKLEDELSKLWSEPDPYPY